VGSDDEDDADGSDAGSEEEEGANLGEAVIDLAAGEEEQRPRGTRGRDTCAAAPLFQCSCILMCMWLLHAAFFCKEEASAVKTIESKLPDGAVKEGKKAMQP
jgi:hypothetical protein